MFNPTETGLSVWLIPPNPIFIPKPDNGGISTGNCGAFPTDGEKEKEKYERRRRGTCVSKCLILIRKTYRPFENGMTT
ncbi:hypothetical protein CEXT_642421 [Caerostris extrusa]|uniref:Uncharacterized protein n=1 Tax=Caerostris extrusa TaxID=172846 RepID=A0AAV4V9E2_CAEEX|nr:hypothetical protein CEXT_642421 [Caerostris extrusa]